MSEDAKGPKKWSVLPGWLRGQRMCSGDTWTKPEKEVVLVL